MCSSESCAILRPGKAEQSGGLSPCPSLVLGLNWPTCRWDSWAQSENWLLDAGCHKLRALAYP
eukprot:3728691-Pyramimonas_sp.AAC.1